ncbi:MAG TPA: hypothetical protein VHO24_16605 [Opitutaceae bacterium]|nr:hypothetical protein [Opitutaceae bacterium]
MPASTHEPPAEPANRRASEEAASCAALLAVATPALYLENPFRRLGLQVLATPREVARRIDELKMSVELGSTVPRWAFAPETEITGIVIREAGQKLKSPRERLISEFFWFWPESYPAESTDEALGFLARGETAPALERWLQAAEAGSNVARHNLAVYHHLLVLDWERLPEDEESRLDEVWPQTLEYWQDLVSHPPMWDLLRQRVEKIADPQVPPSYVGEIRASLSAAIAKINAALLLADAERGRQDRAALHTSLIAMIHRDGVGVRRTLEASAAPVAQRIDTFVAAARRGLHDESANALTIGCNLVRNCDDDLRLVEILCGRDDAYTELSHGVADAAVACLVAHQRRTQDDDACLPLLVYVMNMAVTPELRHRLEETYQVIRGNVVVTGGTADEVAGAEHELEHRLIVEKIIPQLSMLQLSAAGRLRFTTRVAEWLGNLASTAWRDLDRLDLADAVLTTALGLPCDPATRAPLERNQDSLQAERVRRAKIFQLERHGHTVRIDADEICYDDVRLSIPEITGLRYGVLEDGGLAIAWCSAEVVVSLDASNVLDGETAVDDYQAIMRAIDRLLVPALGVQLIEALRGDATILLGETPVSKAGIHLGASPDSPADTPTLVPFERLKVRSDTTTLILSDADNPALKQHHKLSEVWNAVLIATVVEAWSHPSSNPPF